MILKTCKPDQTFCRQFLMVDKYFSGKVIVKNLSSAVDSPSTYEKCMFLGLSILDSDLTGLS